MKKLGLGILLTTFFVLHQDFWNWRTAYPLAFGFLPVGLWYHALYTLGASAMMWLLVKLAWPAHLEQSVDPRPDEKDAK